MLKCLGSLYQGDGGEISDDGTCCSAAVWCAWEEDGDKVVLGGLKATRVPVDGLMGDKVAHRVVGTCLECASGGRGSADCWNGFM